MTIDFNEISTGSKYLVDEFVLLQQNTKHSQSISNQAKIYCLARQPTSDNQSK